MNENKNSGTKRYMIIITLFLAFILGFFILIWQNSPDYHSFDSESAYILNTVWHNTIDATTAEALPAKFPTDPDGHTTLHTTLPDISDPYANTICFRASQNVVKVWADDILLYNDEETYSKNPYVGKAPGSHWVFLRLPSDYAGRELYIDMWSPYEKYQGYLNPVYLGTKSSIIFQIVRIYGDDIAIGFIILILSIALLFFYLIYVSRKVKSNQILYLAIFGALVGFWFIGESQMLQFFTKNLLFWYLLTMGALPLMPLPMLRVFEDLPNFPYKRICKMTKILVMLYYVVLVLLQIFEIRDFMEMLNFTLFLLVIFCIVFPIMIFWDLFINRNNQILPMAIALSALCFFSILELLKGMTTLQTQLGDYLRLGIFAFYVIISVYHIRHAIVLYDETKQAAYYKELSYTDHMTRFQNRRAFTEREETWIYGEKDAVLMADLNYLKYINDNYGHNIGDKYIIQCAEAMTEAFKGKGVCYRIGGDEFLFWGNNLSEEELKKLNQKFTALVEEKCQSISPFCQVATGLSVSEAGDHSFTDILKRADGRMYENKRELKRMI